MVANRNFALALMAACVFGSSPVFGATNPTYWQMAKLRSYAAWTCRLKILAPSCGFDVTPTLSHLVEVEKRFNLSAEQQHNLDDSSETCLQGQKPQTKPDIDPKICEKATALISEMGAQFGPSDPDPDFKPQ